MTRRYSPQAGGSSGGGDLLTRIEALETQVSQPGSPSGTFVISGGQTSYTGDALDVRVTQARYMILGTEYTSPETVLTLAAADPALDRIDTIVLDTTGAAAVVAGVPAEAPIRADVDPFSQIAVSFVHVPAGAVTLPQITRIVVFDEGAGAEWNAVGSATINVAAATDPRLGALHIEGTASGTGASATFTADAPAVLDEASQIGLFVRPVTAWPNGRGLRFYFRNAIGVRVGNIVTLTRNTYGFVNTALAWQNVVLPMADFAIPDGVEVTDLRVEVTGNGTAINFRLDALVLELGSLEPAPSGVPYATRFVHGIVRTDVTRADPQVYTVESADETFVFRIAGVDTVAGAAYQFTVADNRRYKAFTSATAIAATVPPNVLPVGAIIAVRQVGAGAITFTPGAGVTLVPKDGLGFVSDGEGSLVQLVQRAANVWDLIGDLVAA